MSIPTSPHLKEYAQAELRRQRRRADIDRARMLHGKDVTALRRAWLAAHFDRQEGRCAYCAVAMLIRPMKQTAPRRATLDHVVARSKGGADTLENTVAACEACNSSKGDMDAELFKRIRRSGEPRVLRAPK